ncbi:MAG: 6-phospho-3-hexuloisomerase [Methanobacteriaceae archaeon]
MMLMKAAVNEILNNIENATENADENAINNVIGIIIKSNNVFAIGAGRSGLVAKAFAMRLMHLGINVYVVGETTTPAINRGDSIFAISGSGETDTIVSATQIARDREAKVLLITSNPDSRIGNLSDEIIQIEGRTKLDSEKDYIRRQMDGNYRSLAPLGTLFELTSLIMLDGIIAELMDRMDQTENDLKGRHTVLE